MHVTVAGGFGARDPSSGDRKRHTDSGFSLALVQRMPLILPPTQSNEATLPLLKSKPIYEAPWVPVASIIYLHINKDTALDYTAMTDRYAGKRPRRMLLVNPLQEPEEQITDYNNLKFVRFL